MADISTPPRDPADRKAVLFCRACGHEAPYDGGWSVAGENGERTDIVCPDCDELVVSQPQFDAGSRRNAFGFVRPLLQFVNAVVGYDVL